MNESALRPGSVAAAAVLIGGALALAFPQHTASIVRLVIVTCAAGTALYVLALHAPPAWWKSPLDRRRRAGRRARDEVDTILASFGGRRQTIPDGPPLPPETLRLLQPLIAGALERAGIPADTETRVSVLSPAAEAVLRAEALSHIGWRGTVRPDARATAAVVHRILDEVATLSPAAAGRITPQPAGESEHDAHT